jgi:hypothetical protein
MSAIEDIVAIVDSMKERKAQMSAFEGVLSEVSVTLAEILNVLERPDTDSRVADAIISGLRGLTFAAPEIHVNVPVQPTPEVQVTVQPAQVVVMPAEARQMTGWKFTITERDGNNNIRGISMKPDI